MAEQNKIPESLEKDWLDITKRVGVTVIKVNDVKTIIDAMFKFNGRVEDFSEHVIKLTGKKLLDADIKRVLEVTHNYYDMNSLTPFTAYIKEQYNVELPPGDAKDVIGEAVHFYREKEQNEQKKSDENSLNTDQKKSDDIARIAGVIQKQMPVKKTKAVNGSEKKGQPHTSGKTGINFDGIERSDVDLKELELNVNGAISAIKQLIEREKKNGTLSLSDEQRYHGIMDSISNAFADTQRNSYLREEGDKIAWQLRRLKDLDFMARNAMDRKDDLSQ